MKKTVLVTGAEGFIGSHLCIELARLGIGIVAVGHIGDSHHKLMNVSGINFKDYFNRDQIRECLSKHAASLDAVVHLGACSSTSETNCDYLLENNHRYSVRLADYCIQHDIRFIFASSASVYGARGMRSSPSLPMDSLSPLNHYAFSKMLTDSYLDIETDSFGRSNAVSLRFFNVYGPNESHKSGMSSPVSTFNQQAIRNNLINVFKHGQLGVDRQHAYKRDFVYIGDVVKIIVSLIFSSTRGIYDVGTGVPSTFLDVAENILIGGVLIATDKWICKKWTSPRH